MSDLTLALAQSTFRVGDLAGNTRHMIQLAEQARDQGAQLIVFPELALTGYPPEDLLLRPSLSLRVKTALEQLQAVEGIVMIVGYPECHDQQRFNAAAIIAKGQVRGVYRKQCLPNNGVFDEQRYFATGQQPIMFEMAGQKIGLLICEDLWQNHPIQQLKHAGADLVLVLNASPFEIGKHQRRRTLVQQRAHDHQLPIAYVNIVGGQDDLVFDGGSLAANADGQLMLDAPRFKSQLSLLNFNQKQFIPHTLTPDMPATEETYRALVMGLRDYVNHSGFKGVILGLSGGIDSALSLAIAVDAIGAERVHAVMMPYTYTSAISIEDAQAQATRLKVSFHVAEIHPIVESFNKTLAPFFGDQAADTTEENLQARSRGVLLMALSNKFGYMVLTTGNKSEMAVGYATLYGDMVGGFNALKDVYKTQVFELARYRNSLSKTPVIPERVINRPPSAELRPDQTDQDSLPPYDVLDALLHGYIEQDLSAVQLAAQGFDVDLIKKVLQLVDRNEYKRRQAVIGSKISTRAFGRERRYPIVNGWKIGE
ncbi:MAG: NAD+ synthase [Pseudomonadota bacterium]|nr:NAD+ synthase [Pseudomonadota bacterium]